ncbi:polymorphic toxin type 28 domain-containing protein [Micromonospora sp. WMMD736]|uniref:polymorphic toxin type 28 domain-containing protein n=1 Tax=Micromonospora sp. WMMD736 TaxID=3404112 RepID=UPI003B95ED2C
MAVHGGFRLFTRPSRVVAVVVTTALAASLLSGSPALAKPTDPAVAKPPAPSPGRAVKGVKPIPTKFVTSADDAKSTYKPTRTAWPRAASAKIDLPDASAADARAAAPTKTRVAGMPVWVQRGKDAAGQTKPESLTITVADRKATEAAGVDGVLLSVDSDVKAGAVRVGVDYEGFAEAFGGNYGSRLRLVQLPNCALTTPTVSDCRAATPLASTNDPVAKSVSAEVSLAAPDSRTQAGGTMVLAAVATAGDDGGEGGTYAATDLKPSGSWSGGGNTGSFTYSYPLTLPPAASNLVPTVGLSYDSGSVDGQTASTNAQASWVGDGWSTPRSFVEQTFTSCMDDPGGTAAPTETPDRCYDGPMLTLSLNGSSTALVWDSTKRVWKPESDNGEIITHVENANNGSGTYNTDYWRVTLRDGTKYEFGRNRLPGWSGQTGQTETKSVDYTPVYSPHEGDPCYSSSVCTMAYRWNLDYVTDTQGNAMAYYYNQATNFYGRNKGATDASYIRDSNLARIDYGFTDGNAYGTVPNQVLFNTDDRCLSGTCKPLNAANKANWPDVPFDLICASGTDCDDWSPSFFSTVRLTSIDTQQYNTATGKYEKVDSYALTHTMPATGDTTSPTLWLASITRTGHDISAGGSTTAITLPSVSFESIALPNRVDVAGRYPSFYRHRIFTITTETGSVISPSFELPAKCSAPVSLDPATNTKSCYPVYWTPQGLTNPIRDWFNKYAVTRVTSSDPTGGSAGLSTSYKYSDAAWHYDENEVVKAKYRSYGQFRGYAKVRTFTGDGVNDRRTQAETVYHQGMSKNNNSIVLNLTDSAGGEHEDVDDLAGRELETTQYLGENGRVDSSTITSYWVSAATATRSRTGLSALTAQWIAPAKTYTRQAITSGGSTTWRNTAADNSYDANTTSATFGALKNTYTYTVPLDPAYNQCTTYTYAPVNTGKNLAALVSQTETVSVACGGFTQGTPASVPGAVNTLTAPGTVSRPAQVVKAERTFYDVTDFATAFPQTAPPSKGNATMTQVAKDYISGAYTWQTAGRSVYDPYGRVTDSYDANGNKSTTGYTMNSAGLLISTTTKNAAGHESSTTVNPRRGHVLTATDANKVVTSQQYDALGRATTVWLHSRPTSSFANYKYAYTVSKTGASATTTDTLNNANGYQKSVTIYDALLRTRQTQSMTPKSGRMITDTFYDTHGWTTTTFNGWWDDVTTPTVSTPVSARELAKAVPNQTLTTYDGLGRAVVVTNAKDGVTVSQVTTVHGGDRTTVVPPTGGVVTTTDIDPIGRKKELQEYAARPTVTAPADTFTGTFTVTGGTATISKYGYDAHGNQSTLTDANNNQWTSTYNLLGQVVAKSDPDGGDSSLSYDANGNLEEVTDGRGKTLSYTYDGINRKTGEYASAAANQSAATKRAEWVYDNSNSVPDVTNPIGKLTTTIAYRSGQTYTTQQKAFDTFGNSLGTTVTVPDSEGALAGSYQFDHSYTSVLGLPLTDTYPAKGGLPSERVGYGYSGQLDLRTTMIGLAGYVSAVSYDAYGRVNQQTLGSGSNSADVTNVFDDHTSRLKSQSVRRSTTLPKEVDQQDYEYDLVGNITRKISKRLGATTPSEAQCYGYDGLARLTEAWTSTDACATMPTDTNKTMVGNTIGAGSAYWTSWQIDLIGNRTQQVEHNLAAGGTDTKTTYTYNGTGQNKPHTLTSTTISGGTTGRTSYAYDNAGNTISRNAAQGNQTLTWDDAGKLAEITGGASGNNAFTYDADGNLLLQKEPGKNILYLPGQQLTLDTATNAVTGHRYYALPGGGSCIRTGSGTAYTFAISDHQGTPTLYLDSTAQNPTWRQYTPYGAPRGATVATPDNRGFLNKPMSLAGLTAVGARFYDSTLGRFISVDPLQDAAQPQQWNGYSYANNTPVTSSDPSGLIPADCKYFDCYGYDVKKGCPGGCGSTENLKYNEATGRSSTKAGSGKGPSAAKGRVTVAGISLQEGDTYDAFELAQRVAQAQETVPRLSGHADYDGLRLLELACLDAGRLCSLDFKDFIRQARVGLLDVYSDNSSESLYGKLSVSGAVAGGDGRSSPVSRVPFTMQGTKSGRIVRDHLQPKDLTGAQRELRGEVLGRRSNGKPYDHIDEVTSAQAGLFNRINTIKSRLGTVNLNSTTRASLQIELGYASRMLDYSYKYMPRRFPV